MGEVFNREHDHSLSTSYERQRQPASRLKSFSNWTKTALAGLMLASAPAAAEESERSFSIEPRKKVEAPFDPTVVTSKETPPPPVSIIGAHMMIQRKFDKEVDAKIRQGTLAVRFLKCDEELKNCRECMKDGTGTKETFAKARKDYERARKALSKEVGMPVLVIGPAVVRKMLDASTQTEADTTNADLQSHTFFAVNKELIEQGLNEVVDVEDWMTDQKKIKQLQQSVADVPLTPPPSVKTSSEAVLPVALPIQQRETEVLEPKQKNADTPEDEFSLYRDDANLPDEDIQLSFLAEQMIQKLFNASELTPESINDKPEKEILMREAKDILQGVLALRAINGDREAQIKLIKKNAAENNQPARLVPSIVVTPIIQYRFNQQIQKSAQEMNGKLKGTLQKIEPKQVQAALSQILRFEDAMRAMKAKREQVVKETIHTVATDAPPAISIEIAPTPITPIAENNE